MSVDRRGAAERSFLDVLAGIQAGVLGGLAMLAWFAIATPLLGKPWYLIPNLLATRFHVSREVLLTAGAPTWTGAAWLIFAAGIVGAVNGILTPGGRLFGLAVAGTWYLVSYLFVWKRLAPYMLIYAPQPVVVLGFLVYGSVIGWHPQLLARVRSNG